VMCASGGVCGELVGVEAAGVDTARLWAVCRWWRFEGNVVQLAV
jgi:hypothetical protein